MKHADMQEIQLAYIFCELSKKKKKSSLLTYTCIVASWAKTWEIVGAKRSV